MRIQGLSVLLISTTLILAIQCAPNEEYKSQVQDRKYLNQALEKLTEIIVYDIFSPPVASRIYAYASIAAYETVSADQREVYPSLSGKISGLDAFPSPTPDLVNPYIASVFAFTTVGKALIFSEPKMDELIQQLQEEYSDIGVPRKVLAESVAYGELVGQHVMNWASKDNYNQTRTLPKFDLRNDVGRWQPTPPDYMEGIEPHWTEIRTLVIDSSDQFTPPLPTFFDMTEGSDFHTEVMEVYETGRSLDDEKTAIAQFWDCNPFVSHHKGHVMFATKKITPGGHWMGIAQIAAAKDSADIIKTAQTYAYTAITLFDAFISCWDEKYRSNLIRPETVINKHIDEDWTPLLQTPPFPEYTSGHSVISSAAAVMLTRIYGENFSFDDTSEIPYGLPMRSFGSFTEASQEAAISRLYGGIHYMPAIDNGVAQGSKLGSFVVQALIKEFE